MPTEKQPDLPLQIKDDIFFLKSVEDFEKVVVHVNYDQPLKEWTRREMDGAPVSYPCIAIIQWKYEGYDYIQVKTLTLGEIENLQWK